MKALRFWLVLLLVVLLPIRGALAATMLCGSMGGHAAQASVQPSAPVPSHAVHDCGEAAPAQHATASHDHAPKAHDKCNLCASFCSATPLMSEAPTVAAPASFSTVAFPSLGAPSPTFISGGPERPPRSL